MFAASLSMLPSPINGLMYGAIYALVALGLTLIYGVLHGINLYGAMLMLALYAAFFLFHLFGIDPYLAIVIVTPAALSLAMVTAGVSDCQAGATRIFFVTPCRSSLRMRRCSSSWGSANGQPVLQL